MQGSQGCTKTLGHPACPCGDPIDVSTGNVFETATDYETAGQNKLSFIRYYNSFAATDTVSGELGGFWRSNYDRFIQIVSSSNVFIERANGQQLIFTLTGGVWTSDSDVDITLTNSGTTWTVTDHDDTVETYTTYSGSSFALLDSIKLRNGYTQTLNYTGREATSVTDSYGRTLTLTYNTNGTLASITTPDSTTISYTLTAASYGSNLTSVTYPTGTSYPAGTETQTITYNYANTTWPNALTSIEDEAGQTYATWTYDTATGRATGNYMGGTLNANSVSISYPSATTTTVTNANGVVDTYTFSILQGVPKLTGISRASTSTTPAMSRSFTYDSNGYLASSTDWNGNSTHYTNDAHGDPTSIVEAYGTSVARTTSITYDTTWVHLPDSVVTTGLTTSFTYDTHGEALTKTLTDTTTGTIPYSTSGSRIWTYTWSSGELASVTTPNNHGTSYKTSFSYATDGALTGITNALGQATTITNTGGGYPLTIEDPNSVTTTIAYDGRQRWITSTVGLTGTTFTTSRYYYNNGQVSTVWPDGSVLIDILDTAHRYEGLANNLNNQINETLDVLGNPLTTKYLNPSSVVEYERTATYDSLGRKLDDTSVVTGQSYVMTYDNNGNQLTVTDPLSHATTNLYDALNRLYKSTDANSGIVQYTFDAHDRPLTVEDKNGNTTTYTYDGYGDVIQQASPDTGTTIFYYDSDGNLTSKEDAGSVITNYSYDKIDRMLTTSYPANSYENVTYTYDQSGYGYSIGRLTTVTDEVGSLVRFYDERGNLLTEERHDGGTTLWNTTWTYDANSNVASITYPSGSIVTYARNAIGQVTSIVAQAPGHTAVTLLSGITYEPFGPLTGDTAFNSDAETFSFDQDYRMTQLQLAGTYNNFNQTYTYDNANNMTALSDAYCSVCSGSYTYDSINRVLTGSGWWGTTTYSYDKNGNQLTNNENYSATNTIASGSNRITSISVSGTAYPVSYTSQGNISAITRTPGNALSFTYYNANEMYSSVANGGSTNYYFYDAFRRRFAKYVSATSLYFYDQSGNMIAEETGVDGGGETPTYSEYIWLGNRLIGTLAPATNTLAVVHVDKLGDPWSATDSNKYISQLFDYAPYLNTTTPYQQSGSATIVQRQRSVGMYLDAETSLNHNGYRDYFPALGRYIESDPIGLGGGLNTYAYADGNPLSNVDPSGLASRPLTTGEQKMVNSVFPAADPTKMSVSNDPVPLFQSSNGDMAMTPGNTMHMVGSDYSDDYSNAGLLEQCHFVHEATHAYQSQSNFLPNAVHKMFDSGYNYSLNGHKSWSDFGIEQQAVIASDYYALSRGFSPVIHRDQNGIPYGNTDVGPPWVNQYKQVMEQH